MREGVLRPFSVSPVFTSGDCEEVNKRSSGRRALFEIDRYIQTLKKVRLITSDFLKYNGASRSIICHLLETAELFRAADNPNSIARSLERLALAARLGAEKCHLSNLEKKIGEKIARWSPDGFDWDRFFPGSKPQLIRKAMILKKPQADEKGVLFIAFEDNWLRLLRYGNVRQIARDYDLIISPSWSPPYDLALLIVSKLWPATLFTILSSFNDEGVFSRLANNIKTIPLLASSWVNAETFIPDTSLHKHYDIAVLANFASYKRHFALFRALHEMDKSLRVLLLGRSWAGRTKSTLEGEARLFGVLNKITIAEGLADREMIQALQSAKVSVIMSLAEGACVAVTESLFADVPVGLIEGATVGSRAFINDQTGCFLRPAHIAEDLGAFIQRYRSYQPRKWMLEQGLSYKESSRTLNEMIRTHTLETGRPWTIDLLPMQWRPNAEFLSQADRQSVLDEYNRFERAYGIAVHVTT